MDKAQCWQDTPALEQPGVDVIPPEDFAHEPQSYCSELHILRIMSMSIRYIVFISQTMKNCHLHHMTLAADTDMILCRNSTLLGDCGACDLTLTVQPTQTIE